VGEDCRECRQADRRCAARIAPLERNGRRPPAVYASGCPMLANSQTQYGWTAIVLHWAMALLLFGQWTLGQTMVRISDQRLAFDLFQWHKSFGLLVLALAILRLAWRLANPRPLLPAGTPRLEQAAAASTHRALYALMILLPLSGWALVSASVLEI